ncbi:PREDICTED: defensin-like protein [Nelumbo nucifera]|uniref:Defensin-like protein n=3 Tax=Nelumbo nucifera TaxID=4432 RepID=DEF_NELNU|nr:defensin-like protein precursor [Nelumbo nucifera]A3FPF2.1 RecName: Full=Defensin-like protein; AltName: Full=Gamma-thionin homolog; Flags: Precursor [Nelumbo nucifera]ABN46979.1 defensin [Nelumbo nucifera]
MERGMRLFSSLVLVLLLVTATEMGPKVAEARTCESQSHRFKGACLSDTNCASVCQTEGFPAGDCKGARRRCFCVKPC